MDGKRITPKSLTQAIHTLSKEKRIAVLLSYFFHMSDMEISKLLNVPKSTVQYRQISALERLKRFLEEHAGEWDDINTKTENNERGY
ncbi:RNA polymerase sigma factor [Pseudogracilibacillus sp. SO30301A]|uniref:RNA polymerase sigma factor n=1 Tax=Pseudogracilibacillus sp. SO30301A TaxID=3098291 RepID=UPI00300DC661